MLLQFIDEGTAAVSDFRRLGANHAMHEFGDGHRRDSDLDLAEGLPDERQRVRLAGLVLQDGGRWRVRRFWGEIEQ